MFCSRNFRWKLCPETHTTKFAIFPLPCRRVLLLSPFCSGVRKGDFLPRLPFFLYFPLAFSFPVESPFKKEKNRRSTTLQLLIGVLSTRGKRGVLQRCYPGIVLALRLIYAWVLGIIFPINNTVEEDN